jgi:hypothetical protein
VNAAASGLIEIEDTSSDQEFRELEIAPVNLMSLEEAKV